MRMLREILCILKRECIAIDWKCLMDCFEAYRNPPYSAKETWQLLHDCVYSCVVGGDE